VILARRGLLARLGAAEPRLVRVCAPAGYGKTDFAGVLARRFDRHAICDCAGLKGTIDFAGRLMSALAGESYGNGDAIARTRLLLHATETGEAAWIREFLDCWKLRQERALLILLNADAIAHQPRVLALLGDMLAARPAERVLLVSSREPLPIDAGRYFAPHQILTLRDSDLRLDADEAASVFEGSDLSQPTVDRVLALAGGWPVALLLLARIAHYEPDIDQLLDRLASIETDLHEHLVHEVLSALTPEMTATMLAIAAIPDATLEDISVATEVAHAAPIVEGLLRLPGFISYQSGAYHMHPLPHSALRARHESDLNTFVLRAAGGNERVGDFLRAAELYNVAGDTQAAAAALDRLPAAALQQPSPRLADALANIPIETIAAHPNLWIGVLPYRRQTIDAERLHAGSVALQKVVDPNALPALYRRLGVRRAILACELNRLTEARETLHDLEKVSAESDTPEERRLSSIAAAVVAAKQGRFFEADAFVEQADAVHHARHLRFEEERAEIAMEKAAAYGDWDDLLKIGEDRLNAALRAGRTERIVEAARAVGRAAWYRGDDDRVAAAAQIVKDCGYSEAGSVEGAAIADLQSALVATDLERAAAMLDRAIERVDACENHFLRIVVRVCAALLAPAQRRRLIEARGIAQQIESPPLQTSLELLIDSPETRDYGIFERLGARVATSPLKVRHDRLFVDVMRGTVRRGSERLHVSDRGLELLAALALFDGGTVNEDLAAALWPALDARAAVNALKMCVSRTRAQLGDREAIQSARNGYAIGEHVESDVRELKRLLHSVRGAGTIGESLRLQITQALGAWGARPPARAGDWPWFAPYGEHLADVRRELANALAKDTARREQFVYK